MFKKLISILLIVASVIAVIPIGASAAWKNDNAGWWYTEGDSYSTGWRQIDRSWYYFRNDGYMKRGWVQIGLSWYYLQDNGIMATGKVTVSDRLYEFDNNGRWINNSDSDATAIINASTSTTGPSEDKLKATPKYSWFNDNGNTYFKAERTFYVKGVWNIDGYVYTFDKNGAIQKGEYTSPDGVKFILGSDGKTIKCINDKGYKLCSGNAITTKSSSNNHVVKLDDSHMMDITHVYSDDLAKNEVRIKGATGYYLDKTQPKATVEGKILYCKTNQSIGLGTIKVNGTDTESSSFPNLAIISDSTDKNIAYSVVDLSLEDGFLRNIHPTIIAYKPGKATITIRINGTKTSFDVVVTE